MNAEQKLARILAIVTDNAQGTPTPWYRDTSSPMPGGPLEDVTNVDEIKRYTAHRLRTNYSYGVAEQDWATMLNYCDKIFASQTPQEREAVIAGAGHFSSDVAINLVLGGGTQGGGFSPLMIYAPWGSNFDMVQSAAWLSALPNSGAGPSGG